MTDTIALLKECDSGTKMAVSSIDEVVERTKNPDLRNLLLRSKDAHGKLGNEIHALLSAHHSATREPSPMAKGMSWMKTNMKMAMDDSDAMAANLITDGCNMGVKSLNEYLNQYTAADHTSKTICKKLIAIEESLCKELQKYL